MISISKNHHLFTSKLITPQQLTNLFSHYFHSYNIKTIDDLAKHIQHINHSYQQQQQHQQHQHFHQQHHCLYQPTNLDIINIFNKINITRMKQQTHKPNERSINRLHENIQLVLDYVVLNHDKYDLVFYNQLFLKLDRIDYDVQKVKNNQYFFKKTIQQFVSDIQDHLVTLIEHELQSNGYQQLINIMHAYANILQYLYKGQTYTAVLDYLNIELQKLDVCYLNKYKIKPLIQALHRTKVFHNEIKLLNILVTKMESMIEQFSLNEQIHIYTLYGRSLNQSQKYRFKIPNAIYIIRNNIQQGLPDLQLNQFVQLIQCTIGLPNENIIKKIRELVVDKIINNQGYIYELGGLCKLVFYSTQSNKDNRFTQKQLFTIVKEISYKIRNDQTWINSNYNQNFCLLIVGLTKYQFINNPQCKVHHQIFELLQKNKVFDSQKYHKRYQIQLLYNLDVLNIDRQGLIKKYIVSILKNDFDGLVATYSKENAFYCLKLLDEDSPTEEQVVQLEKIYSYFKDIQQYKEQKDQNKKKEYEKQFYISISSLFSIIEFDYEKNNYQSRVIDLFIGYLVEEYCRLESQREMEHNIDDRYFDKNGKQILKFLYIYGMNRNYVYYMINRHNLYEQLSRMVHRFTDSELIQLINIYKSMSEYVSFHSLNLICISITARIQNQIDNWQQQQQDQKIDQQIYLLIMVLIKYVEVIRFIKTSSMFSINGNGNQNIRKLDHTISEFYRRCSQDQIKVLNKLLDDQSLTKYQKQLELCRIQSELFELVNSKKVEYSVQNYRSLDDLHKHNKLKYVVSLDQNNQTYQQFTHQYFNTVSQQYSQQYQSTNQQKDGPSTNQIPDLTHVIGRDNVLNQNQIDFMVRIYSKMSIQLFIYLFVINMRYFGNDNKHYKNHLIELMLQNMNQKEYETDLDDKKGRLYFLFEIIRLIHDDHMRLSKRNYLFLSLELDDCMSRIQNVSRIIDQIERLLVYYDYKRYQQLEPFFAVIYKYVNKTVEINSKEAVLVFFRFFQALAINYDYSQFFQKMHLNDGQCFTKILLEIVNKLERFTPNQLLQVIMISSKLRLHHQQFYQAIKDNISKNIKYYLKYADEIAYNIAKVDYHNSADFIETLINHKPVDQPSQQLFINLWSLLVCQKWNQSIVEQFLQIDLNDQHLQNNTQIEMVNQICSYLLVKQQGISQEQNKSLSQKVFIKLYCVAEQLETQEQQELYQQNYQIDI